MKKSEKKNPESVPSGFYNRTLTTQGRDGEHKRFPMDFYTGNASKKSLEAVAKDFPGDFYKADKD